MEKKEKVYRADTYRYRLGYDGKLRVNVLNGCFFTCAYKKYFNRSKKADRIEAINRIEARISEWEAKNVTCKHPGGEK